MEAGINPVQNSVTQFIGSKLYEYGHIIHNLCSFTAQNTNRSEQNIISSLLNTILIHTKTYIAHHNTHELQLSLRDSNTLTETYKTLTQIHELLWKDLKVPHPTDTRSKILNFLILLQIFTDSNLYSTPSNQNESNQKPFLQSKKTSKPSFFQQVTSQQSKTIDPYLIALTRNYYFPINLETMSEEMEDDNISFVAQANTETMTSQKSPTTKAITVEDSLETITDIINELEEDDPPVQTQLTQSNESAVQQAVQLQTSSYTHRFSIYRRNGIPIHNLKTPTQISLFQSFCKCLKSIDPQLQILPIRNDHNIHSISTTDQITNIDEIGITNYFKAYKRTKRTLSGDFHINTKVSFDELKSHRNLSTWFHLNGYNITISGCQTSDMVRIGFLSRVRGFTYRDDMHEFITNTEQWRQNTFHFRLYFDIFSSGTKGKNTYVLMIEVDRPNIEKATTYFQQNFNGDKPNSPNKISYLFFPLYRKTYTEDERLSIIRDNDHHTENDSVVGIHSLNNLNTIVKMTQGIHITIRHLLLAIPCQGTSNGKLFHQIERQANNEWHLCCFHTMDTTKISLKLANLETLIKRFIHVEDHKNLFLDPAKPLKFSGQAAPIKKGKPKIPILEVPEETLKYTSQAFTKLFTPIPKRPATPQIIENLNETLNTPQTRITINTPSPQILENSISNNIDTTSNNADLSDKVKSVEIDIKNQNNRLARLEDICSQLATSTQNLSTQLLSMNQNMNERLIEMANSVDLLHQHPTQRTTKYQKFHHGLDEDTTTQS